MVDRRSNKGVRSADDDKAIEEAGERVQSEHQASSELGQKGHDALNPQPAADGDVETDLTLALPYKKRSRPDMGGSSSASLAFVVDEGTAPAAVIAQAALQPILAASMVGGAQQQVDADAVGGAEGERQLWACSDCHRTFKGRKALFGHQRVHPSRPYRGAYPPPTFNPEGSPEQVPDLPVLQVQEQPTNVEEAADAGAREADGSSSTGRKRRFVLNEDDSEGCC